MKMKIKLKEGQNIFFTSDTHYDHKNICLGTTEWKSEDKNGSHLKCRDFETLEEMNKYIVDSINMNVKEDDILFHLGDWSFGGIENISKFRKQINCKNVHLILGNHDQHIRKEDFINKRDLLFKSVHDILNLTVVFPQKNKHVKAEKINLVLFHFPIASWDNMRRGVIHLHGHLHLSPTNKYLGEGKILDVGVEGNNYNPYNLKDIIKIMEDRPTKSLINWDHH